jgi:hypothetical protein
LRSSFVAFRFWKGPVVFKTLSCLFVLLLVGCAASVTDPAQSSDHPANPAASEAAVPEPSQTLAVTQAPTTAPSDHSMQHMPGMQHGNTHDMPATQAAAKYTCPMHPDVISDQPGKCPKCGMTLAPKKGAP